MHDEDILSDKTSFRKPLLLQFDEILFHGFLNNVGVILLIILLSHTTANMFKGLFLIIIKQFKRYYAKSFCLFTANSPDSEKAYTGSFKELKIWLKIDFAELHQ